MTIDPAAVDAELAAAAAGGDRAALGVIYDRYADRLHDFCLSIVRDRDTAADCVQEVFCVAATKLTQLRDGDKLRPWLYAIARSEALKHYRRREDPTDAVPEAEATDDGPETIVARGELADLVAAAAGGLSERDRMVLDLTYRHELDGDELAEALGVSRTNAGTLVHRVRETVGRSLGALLVARSPQSCQKLAVMLDGWDGEFTVLVRKRVARHIESCDVCEEERRRKVAPAALLGGAPVFVPAPEWLRDKTLEAADERRVAVGPMRANRRSLLVATALAGLVAAAVVALVTVPRGDVDGEPATVTATTPATTTTTSRPPVAFVPSPPPTTTSTHFSATTAAPTASSSVAPQPPPLPRTRDTTTTEVTRSFSPTIRATPTRQSTPTETEQSQPSSTRRPLPPVVRPSQATETETTPPVIQ